MSVQFGRWNTDGRPADRDYLEKVNSVIAPYGPDDSGSHTKAGVSVFYRGFHTTKESRRESQPHVTESGAIITWDGRLDNRADLIRQIPDHLTTQSTDLSIIVAAYQDWGTGCFAKLIGDWALSIWDARSRSLILAKDPIGTRHLYYSIDEDHVTWSTLLDPLVLFANHSFALNEEYIAGWFSFFPAAHLTPYVGIHSVPPSSSVHVRAGKRTVTQYWDFDPGKRIRYHADAEYEEHFRSVFREAVLRRLRSDSPILAELSGGIDSSSIVCMADSLIGRGAAETPRLNTISYYDNSEPNWNESPYFKKVEEQRRRTGCHVDLSSQVTSLFRHSGNFSANAPRLGSPLSEGIPEFAAYLNSTGSRTMLSGIGGDESMGGVPTPIPELGNLLVAGHMGKFLKQIVAWAFVRREPAWHLIGRTLREFLPFTPAGFEGYRRVSWLKPGFVRRQHVALHGYERRWKVCGPLPSFQANLQAVDSLRRRLACSPLPSFPLYEKRYPYLDRDLLNFLFAIPREQLVRPSQRRSLMRRALAGLVPDEILNRKRKAFVERSPMLLFSQDRPLLLGLTQQMTSDVLGFVNEQAFVAALSEIREGRDKRMMPALRTLGIESWLRHLQKENPLRLAEHANDGGSFRRNEAVRRQNLGHRSRSQGFLGQENPIHKESPRPDRWRAT